MAGPPIVLDTAGEGYLNAGTVIAMVWEGETGVGDRAELTLNGSVDILWSARTEILHTYVGLSLAPNGVEAPRGFYASALTAGRMLVYLK